MPLPIRIFGVAIFAMIALGLLVEGNRYLVERLVLDLALPGEVETALIVLFVGLTGLVILQPIGERMVGVRRIEPLAWVASVWMGVLFYLFVGLLLSHVVLVPTGMAATWGADPTPTSRARSGLVFSFATSVALVGFRAIRRPAVVRKIELRLPRWPADLDGFRIAQISDIHIGPTIRADFAEALVPRVNELDADLIAITGDLVDGQVRHIGHEVAAFGSLYARHGVFFVTGNHDYYSGVDAWIARLEELGIRVLCNERVEIQRDGVAFDLAGVHDHHGHFFGPGHGEDVPRALSGRDVERPVVLLAHDPSTFRAASEHDVDLQISGHTHGGQIWPFGYLVKGALRYVAGHYVKGSSQLWVSRGTGYWGPPMRVRAPAEITEITLRSGDPAATGDVA